MTKNFLKLKLPTNKIGKTTQYFRPIFDDKYFDLQVSSNWSGSGEFSCYGHLSTDVSTPEGGDYLGEGKVQYLTRYHMGPPADTIANREPMLREKN